MDTVVMQDTLADEVGEDLLGGRDAALTAAGDLPTVRGLDNLRRAIFRRLVVSPGEWKSRPDYGVGIKQFLKKPLTAARKAELYNRIVENLRRDARIERIDAVRIEDVMLSGRSVVRVTVHLTVYGRAVGLEPLTFAREP
jgi:phage baseplate assembly protein W